MASPDTSNAPPPATIGASLLGGLRASWVTIALIAAINTAIAGILWIEDPRPFWHPLLTVQVYGFMIAYCVNVASPWDSDRPIRRLVPAVAIGAAVGVLLIILLKGYDWNYVVEKRANFAFNFVLAFFNGLLLSLFFYVKLAAARTQARLARAEAERHLLSKQAVEAELKLMQAQVEPHFLFNTLASVQYLTETDPPGANRLLGHLIAYLRAALPQLRASSTTLGQEVELARAYLNILQSRIGPRLAFTIDVAPALARHPFPPNLLISLVENAIKHGIEPAADGGSVSVAARADGDRLVVEVVDTGRGLALASARDGGGVGLTNVRERLAALYGTRGRFTLTPVEPRGARARLELPLETP